MFVMNPAHRPAAWAWGGNRGQRAYPVRPRPLPIRSRVTPPTGVLATGRGVGWRGEYPGLVRPRFVESGRTVARDWGWRTPLGPGGLLMNAFGLASPVTVIRKQARLSQAKRDPAGSRRPLSPPAGDACFYRRARHVAVPDRWVERSLTSQPVAEPAGSTTCGWPAAGRPVRRG